jgi:hypothetical protein
MYTRTILLLHVIASVAASSYASRARTRRMLSKAVRAIGGKAALRKLYRFTNTRSGSSWIDFEGKTPQDLEATSTFQGQYSFDLDQDLMRVDLVNTAPFENFPSQSYSRIIHGNVGALTGDDTVFIPVGTMPSHHVASIKRQQLLFTPHLLLKKALENPEMVKSATRRVLVIRDEVSDIRVNLNWNGSIKSLELTESNPLVRDTPIMVEYDQWDLTAGQRGESLVFPRSIKMYGINGKLWDETRSAVELSASLVAGTFDLPTDTDLSSFDDVLFQYGLDVHHHVEAFLSIGLYYPALQEISTEKVATNLYRLAATHGSVAITYTGGDSS